MYAAGLKVPFRELALMYNRRIKFSSPPTFPCLEPLALELMPVQYRKTSLVLPTTAIEHQHQGDAHSTDFETKLST
jgi:hypothetical protein